MARKKKEEGPDESPYNVLGCFLIARKRLGANLHHGQEPCLAHALAPKWFVTQHNIYEPTQDTNSNRPRTRILQNG